MDLYLDIGSTNMKWQFGDGEIGHRPFVKNKPEAAPYCEIDLKEILHAVYGILAIQRFDRLFLSVQMHGYVLLDENGSELTDYISWKDRRASLVSIPFTMHSENGVELKDNLPRAGVYAISRLKPELYRSIREFCTFGSYLCRKLTGVNATHITDAAPSGFSTCAPVSAARSSFCRKPAAKWCLSDIIAAHRSLLLSAISRRRCTGLPKTKAHIFSILARRVRCAVFANSPAKGLSRAALFSEQVRSARFRGCLPAKRWRETVRRIKRFCRHTGTRWRVCLRAVP